MPSFNRAQVRRRGCPDAGVELPQHRQTQLLDRLTLDRVREFGYVAEGHGSLGNWVLISKSLEAAWQRLSAIVDETTVLILPLSGRWDHWTVLYDINVRKIRLVDSSHRRELTRSRCTLGATKTRYCLELSGAIAIRRVRP